MLICFILPSCCIMCERSTQRSRYSAKRLAGSDDSNALCKFSASQPATRPFAVQLINHKEQRPFNMASM